MSDTTPANPENHQTLPEKLSEVPRVTWLLLTLVACIVLFLILPFPTSRDARETAGTKTASAQQPPNIEPWYASAAARSSMAFRPAVAALDAETVQGMEALGYLDGGSSGSKSAATEAVALPVTRQLMQTISLSIETKDATQATDAIVSAVEATGGYLANLTDTNNGPGQRFVTISVRVPEKALTNSLATFEALGNVLSKQVATQDVTEEHVDLSARKHNLAQTEERLLSHLSRTATLEDIIVVEKELTRVREQIERIEGRLNFLNNRVQFATVNITLYPAPEAGPLTPTTSFSSKAIATTATRSLVTFLQGVWVRLIWLGVWSPVWGTLFLAAFAIYRVRKKAGA